LRPNLREHLANERTFLAWLRTSVAIIAFGFVVERFSLFLRYLTPSEGIAVPNPQTAILGAGLIWLGTLLIPASLWRYFVEERHIDEPSASRSTNWPMVALAIVLAAVGVYLAMAVVT
jgi:putative membrane protein